MINFPKGKWHYIIKDKEEYLKNKRLVEITRRNITGWLEQEFWIWGGFEMQYRGIKPKILIEPLLRNDINKNTEEIQIFCFSGIPKLIIRIEEGTDNKTTLYDEQLNIINDTFSPGDININRPKDNLINKALVLSIKLTKYFNFVRVDWIVYKKEIYFEELTFTPFSGFHREINLKYNRYFGEITNLKETNNEL